MAVLRGWYCPREDYGTDTGDVSALLRTRGGCLASDGWIAGDDEGRIAALAGHPVWSDAALAALARERGHGEALLTAWRRHGDRVFDKLGGDFVLAVIDPIERRCIAGIDRIGQQALHFARFPGGVVFGSSAAEVLQHPAIARRSNPDGIYHYVFYHMIPAPVSAWTGLEKLQGAQRLSIGDAVTIDHWWQPRFEEPTVADADELGAELRQRLGAAVERMQTEPATGAFLSGGLDSSTVAGMLAQVRPGAADTFSIGFSAEGYDEMDYARLAVRHFGTRAHEYYVTANDVVDAVQQLAAAYDEPFGNSSALPALFCARMAADAGITRLLAGDGGDELFAGNERYLKQRVFELWNRLPAPLRRSVLDPLFTRLPSTAPLLGKARSYVEQARVPLPERLHGYNFLRRIAAEEMFEADFLGAVDRDAPWSLMKDIYHRPEEASTLNRMMYLDWQQTLADNDLRKVIGTCRLAGVDVVFPMLDDGVIEFSCRVPSRLKLTRNRLRHFYKESMSGFLPPEIIDKRKHGFGLPFGPWMREHRPLQELAYDSLARLKTRGQFRPAFIDRLISLHRDQHAAYYGELIWILMVLDLWLDAHTPALAAPEQAPRQMA